MNKLKIIICSLTFSAAIFAGAANAQKYKTAADTVELNKEYKSITADVAELNTKLTADNSKSTDYQQKTAKAKQDAQDAAEKSKEQANVATNGNMKDIKKELKDAKQADNEAKDAKDAASDEKANQKQIKYLNAQIAKKKSKLDELDKERAAIMPQTTATTTN